MINYRNLLIKYIQHVGACEGVSFLSPSFVNDPHFSKEEWKELQFLDKLAEKPMVEVVPHDPYTEEFCPQCGASVSSIFRDGLATRECCNYHRWIPSEGVILNPILA